MPGPLHSVAVQESIIGASLNASMLQNGLTGIYTVVYGTTMYFYISRNKPNPKIVISTISLLYLLSMISFIIEWYWLDQWMVANGSTRQSMFLSTLDGPAPSLFVFNNFIFYLGFVVSDALLIWRCYHVWGMSLRVITVPSVVCLAESGLLVASIVLSALSRGALPSNEMLTHQYNNVISAFVLISLATTVITTYLIGYRIHTVARMNGSRSKRRLNHVMAMILESAAIYSVMLVVLAISTVIPSFNDLGSPGLIASYYIESVANIVAGMAPTILMARIAMKGADTEQTVTPTTPQISELGFGSAAAQDAGGRSHRETDLSIQIISDSQGNNQPGVVVVKGNRTVGTDETEV